MAKNRFLTVLGGAVAGAFVVPFFVLSFVVVSSSKGCKASLVANAKIALVLAIIGAIGGLIYGIVKAVKGKKL